jgi:hypothetical protein
LAATDSVLVGRPVEEERAASDVFDRDEAEFLESTVEAVRPVDDDVSRKADHSLEQETIEFVMLKHD